MFFISIILSFLLATFLQEIKIIDYLKLYYLYLILWIFILFFIKIFSNNFYLIDNLYLKFIFFIFISNTILTDLVERAVYLIIPFLLFLFYFLFEFKKIYFFNNLIYSFFVFIIFYLVKYLLEKKLNKEVLGMGDIFIFAVLPLYFGFFKTILSLQIASILGIFFILIKKLFNFIFFYILKIRNKKLKEYLKNEYISFIPFIFIGLSIVIKFYNFIFLFFNLI